ncbi:MAG: aromatic ring-hydroxylating oxygenase subunit alpha, partial [Alphaproteobacteria bacterium]
MPEANIDRSVRSVLTDDVLAKMGLGVDQARGLPNAAFTDEDFLKLEQKYLFARTWVFAGQASELPDVGDVRPVSVAGRPVILVRGRDGAVRAFHNVCPHRGARLIVEDVDGVAMMACPYHAWTYALDGKLKSRPHFYKPDCHDTQGDDNVSLFEVRCETWHDWIFVNLDGEAEAFDDHIAPVEAWFSGIRLGEMSCAHHETWE